MPAAPIEIIIEEFSSTSTLVKTRPRNASGTWVNRMVRFKTELVPMATRDRAMKIIAPQMVGIRLKVM